ncbi:24390_t:CDS:2, partial [Cetraspora pellucida]
KNLLLTCEENYQKTTPNSTKKIIKEQNSSKPNEETNYKLKLKQTLKHLKGTEQLQDVKENYQKTTQNAKENYQKTIQNAEKNFSTSF